jgi:hypothetical protein
VVGPDGSVGGGGADSAATPSAETRPPFLDPDVVRLAVNLPIEYRVEATLQRA